MPLDDYWVGAADVEMADGANRRLMGDCVRDRGYGDFSYDRTASIDPIIDDRTYGFWIREWVEKYGVDGPRGSGNPPTPSGPAEEKVWFECADQANEELDYTSIYFGQDYPATIEIAAASAQAAAADPDWLSALEEFRGCVEAEGLSISEQTPFMVEVPQDNEMEMIRRYLIEVDCKDQLDLVQRAADILAQYQAPLIEERMSELAAPKKARDDLMERALQILGGG